MEGWRVALCVYVCVCVCFGGEGGTPCLSVRRHDKETQELVYMQQWENKLKIPAGTQMHIKTGLFEK